MPTAFFVFKHTQLIFASNILIIVYTEWLDNVTLLKIKLYEMRPEVEERLRI